ncbi:MAG TPA: hypothetical protein VMM93_06800, partial [Vicinamibacterales bacterium]|nr:hypothetical protein [Vicinamibacterales bacterium]
MRSSEPQPSFFDDESQPRPNARGLIVVPQPGRPLTKGQQAFNRLVRRVEKLRMQLETRKRKLEADLVFQAEHIVPRLTQVTASRKALVRALRPFLSDARLKAADRRILKRLAAEHLSEIP